MNIYECLLKMEKFGEILEKYWKNLGKLLWYSDKCCRIFYKY